MKGTLGDGVKSHCFHLMLSGRSCFLCEVGLFINIPYTFVPTTLILFKNDQSDSEMINIVSEKMPIKSCVWWWGEGFQHTYKPSAWGG